MNNSNPNPNDAQAEIPTLIRALHRAKGSGVVLLATDEEGEVKTLGGCRVEELEQHRELLEKHLSGTLFLTINSFPISKNPVATGLNFACREGERALDLNATWVDLDTGRATGEDGARLKTETALEKFWELVGIGKLPRPSLIVKSGRGAWILYLLHDREDKDRPPKAGKKTLAMQRAICEELARQLSHLGADPKSVDPARVFRVPYSTNPKSKRRARWDYFTDPDGKTLTYSLGELIEKLGVKVEWEKRKGAFYGSRTIKNRGSSPLRINGKIERARRRCSDIEKVSDHRKGFKEGHRWHVLTAYAHLLRAAEVNDDQLKARVETLAQECRPPFPSSKSDGTTAQIVKNAIDRTHPEHNFKEATLFQHLNLTEKEARSLELVSILTPKIRAEKREAKPTCNRVRQLEARLTAIKAIMEAFPSLSASECQSALESQGITTSLKTVKRNMNDIAPDRQKPVNQHAQGHQQQELLPPAKPIIIKKGEGKLRLSSISNSCDPALLDTFFIWKPVEAETSLPGKPETFYPLLLAGISAKNRETPSYLESICQIGRPVRDR